MIPSLISAMSINGVIGNDGTLPWHFPSDLKYFKEKTLGKPVIMGRKTFEAEGMPKPLPKRRNIIVTRNQNYNTPYKVEVVHSLDQAINLCNEEEIFIIGGAQLYKEAIDIVDKLYITFINEEYEGDTFFPSFDWQNFTMLSSETIEEKGTRLTFVEAIRAGRVIRISSE